MSFLERLKEGLAKTRKGFMSRLNNLVVMNKNIDDEFFESLEEILLQSDVGVATTMDLVERIKQKVKEKKIQEVEEIKDILKNEITEILGTRTDPIRIQPQGTTVIMVVGVNGVGKTTTIGKLAHNFRQEGKKVMLAAGDTFRAAATEQLEIWAERTGAGIIKHQEGADPAAVSFDAIQAARSRHMDVLLIDTAGRLHSRKNLMDELNKIYRVIQKEMSGAPHEVLLVIDATTGQNALAQAQLFQEAAGVTGIALTKLDGTAKGGIVIAVSDQLKIPVKFIGLGEGVEDLKVFQPREFVEALFIGE
ncbi:MAG TPA: signal recognition particle-docking protein FtsY [Clostridia bacterium]|nr:signal recognition particle-docking protein FtsY [Clostridia bacterium]